MLALTREAALDALLSAPRTSSLDRGAIPPVERCRSWLEDVEQRFRQLRHPIASFVVSQIDLLDAVRDRYQPEGIVASGRGARERAVAAVIVDRTVDNLGAIVETADRTLQEMRDRMARLLAVESMEHPIEVSGTAPSSDEVWPRLGQSETTANMRAYLSVRLTASDRRYLLDELLANLADSAG